VLDQVDEVVLLRPLDEADRLEIVRRQVCAVAQRLQSQHALELTIADEALALLARRAASGHSGAREIERTISRLLLEPLGRDLLAGRIQPGDRVRAEPHADALALVRDASST
jgi:ATP-dependent Clp protease ATP-binding subunit ClpA